MSSCRQSPASLITEQLSLFHQPTRQTPLFVKRKIRPRRFSHTAIIRGVWCALYHARIWRATATLSKMSKEAGSAGSGVMSTGARGTAIRTCGARAAANGGRKTRGPGRGASEGMQAGTRPYWPVKQPGQREQFTLSDRESSVSTSGVLMFTATGRALPSHVHVRHRVRRFGPGPWLRHREHEFPGPVMRPAGQRVTARPAV